MEKSPLGGPIVSLFAEEPSLRDRIDAFVISLGERVDTLQDCEVHGDFSQAAKHAHELAREAILLGFTPLEEAARVVEAVSLAGDARSLREQLLCLTELACRVRRGHPGATP